MRAKTPGLTMHASPEQTCLFDARPQRVDRLLCLGLLGLAGIGLLMESFALLIDDDWLFGLHSIISLDYSQNLPQWYYTILLIAGAVLSGLAFTLDRDAAPNRKRWIVLASFCVILALSEFADLGDIARDVFRVVSQPEFYETLLHHHPQLAWAGSAFIVLLLLLAIPDIFAGLRGLVRLSGPTRSRLVLAAGVLIAAPHIDKLSVPKTQTSPTIIAELARLASPGFDIIESSAMILGASLIVSAVVCELFEHSSSSARRRLSIRFS